MQKCTILSRTRTHTHTPVCTLTTFSIHTAVLSIEHILGQTRTFLHLALFDVWREKEWFSGVWSIRSSFTHTKRFSAEE